MSSVNSVKLCPECQARPIAQGGRNPPRTCGGDKCRQRRARRIDRHDALIASVSTRWPFNSSPSEEVLLARLLRPRLRSNKGVAHGSVSVVAFKHGIELHEERINTFLEALVSDVVDETVTPAGERMYIFTRASSHGNPANQGESETVTLSADALSKKGARVSGDGHAEAVTTSAAKADARRVPAGTKRGSAETTRSVVEGGTGTGHLAPPSPPPQADADEGGESPNDHTAIAAWRSAHAALGEDPSVKCIAPLHLDGGTSFRITAPLAAWDPALRALLGPRRGSGHPQTVELADPTTGVVLEATVYRPWGGSYVKIVFASHAELTLSPFQRPATAKLKADANALWRDGARAWMTTWFDRVTRWLTGRACPSPQDARDLGWTAVNIEVASDFTGLRFYLEDVPRFDKGRGKIGTVFSRDLRPDGQVETIDIGRRDKDRLSVTTHDKTQAVLHNKGTPASSVYAPTWREYGWDGDADIRRVELRAHGSAIKLRSRSGPTLDMTDPASLLDPAMVGAFWFHATTTRTHLRAPDGEKTDPRWLAVQAAGGIAEQSRFAQVSRSETRRLDLAERRELAEGEAARKLGYAHGLFGGASLEELLERLVQRSEYNAALRVSASSARDDVRATLGAHPQDEDAHMLEPGEHIASEDVHCPISKCPSAGDDGSGA
jgi:hypothetical protein